MHDQVFCLGYEAELDTSIVFFDDQNHKKATAKVNSDNTDV